MWIKHKIKIIGHDNINNSESRTSWLRFGYTLLRTVFLVSVMSGVDGPRFQRTVKV